ncbi:hypothetical protein P43SY_002024 [Pythium insidiosum]|uniref:peptidylprolyl isomerase n=1 Tax=Pythium insidiosum TaxID=114742 RepID=A0AAD5QCE0_PYTIN|nr:hypothetical protein P43SY_002024 [Pythium insidiosum]
MGKNRSKSKSANNGSAEAASQTAEIASVPGFFGYVVKPGQTLAWPNEVEEFALQLNTAALGSKVQAGRTTLFVNVKDSKVALCTLSQGATEQWNLNHLITPFDGPVALCTLSQGATEQWNLNHLITPFDGPVEFTCEGVNELHLTGFIEVQDAETEDEDDEMGCEDDDCDGCEMDEMDGQYSDSDIEDDEDGDVMVFGGDDDDDDDDDDEDDDEDDDDEEDEGRFEVIEERLHGETTPKKATPSKKDATPAKKETPKKEATPAKKEATPAKKEATPSKKEATPAKKEATPAKKEATPAKKETPKKEATPAKKEAESAGKKRAAPADAVEVPKKAKTTRLYKGVSIEEQAVGKGQPVQKGKKVSILYRGRLENGKQFDAQQNRKRPFVFRHGIGDVIKGMDIGIEGMRRTITIPAHLGYGRQGAPPTIPGNATLVFDIELL